jgi:hypothetical protein
MANLADMSTSRECHPEEIECFRMPNGGHFLANERYEYSYATRKSFEYIPALDRRDWRYFTTKPFTYAGKWLRSSDGGSEVFMDETGRGERGNEKIVSWDSEGTMCWRVCPYASDDEIFNVVEKVMDEVVERVVEKSHSKPVVEKFTAPVPASTSSTSLIHCIFGHPSKCAMFDSAETTTMEPKYSVHPNIAEFWCFITSFFYGSSLLLYFVKEEDWFEEWRNATGWPDYIHFSIGFSVLVMIFSAVYHIFNIEVVGCIDCFLASYMIASVTMSVFGIDIITQIGVLLGIGMLNLNAWRYSTRLALIVVGAVYPFAMLSCLRMNSYYGVAVFLLVNIGLACFLLDRMGYAPLHSIWHILGGVAIAVSLYHVVVNGTLTFKECIPFNL